MGHMAGRTHRGAAKSTPVGRHGQLRAKGNRIVDGRGENVVMRGMSLFWSQWQPQYFNADAVRWLQDDWKVDIVRAPLAVHEDGYLRYPRREMRKIQTVIEAAIDLGLYVIVDWHAHQPETALAGEFFSRIAGLYGGCANVIYEIWSEPLPLHDWSTVIKPHHASVIQKVRMHDPNNLIVAGTQTWSQDVDKAAADPLAFDNVAYALHFYAQTHGQALRDKASAALAKGAALMVTEWGTSDASGSGPFNEPETRRWWAFMEANQLSYVNWSVADKNETSAALMPGAAAEGGWSTKMISPSGRLVRGQLRKMNSAR